MKLRKNIVGLLIACALGTPLAGLAADAHTTDGALAEPVKSVYDHYLKIHGALARDSMAEVGQNAQLIAKAVRGDTMKTLPVQVAKEADALAKAKDLLSARQAFKPLSASLVKYLADKKAGKGVYHEAYCPMARASWVQTGSQIENPYYGTSMRSCGMFRN